SNRIDCIVFLDDRNLLVGEQRRSSIIDIVASKTVSYDLLADCIVSYPEQKLIVVTGPNGVGVHQVCFQEEKKIIEKGFKENTTKSYFGGKSFLMNGGKHLITCKGNK